MDQLSDQVRKRPEKQVVIFTKRMRYYNNPFLEENEDLFNIVTKKVIPKSAEKEMCQQPHIGKEIFRKFVSKRINTNEVNHWEHMQKKENL